MRMKRRRYNNSTIIIHLLISLFEFHNTFNDLFHIFKLKNKQKYIIFNLNTLINLYIIIVSIIKKKYVREISTIQNKFFNLDFAFRYYNFFMATYIVVYYNHSKLKWKNNLNFKFSFAYFYS